MLLAMVINLDCPREGLRVRQSYLLYVAQGVLLATWLEQIDDKTGFFTTGTGRASKIPQASLSIPNLTA